MTFKEVSHEVIKDYGLDTVKRWSQDSNPTIARIFKECIKASGSDKP